MTEADLRKLFEAYLTRVLGVNASDMVIASNWAIFLEEAQKLGLALKAE